MRRRTTASATAWPLGLLLVACEASEPLPPVTWEGRHIAFATDVREKPLCGGHPRFEDAFFGALGEALGEPLPGGLVAYYWLAEAGYAEAGCLEDSWGCYSPRRGQIFTRFIPHKHEIVHAVSDRIGLGSHEFLEEGLAELFGDPMPWASMPQADVGIRDGLAFTGLRQDFPTEFYGRAGHFMRFLFDEFGAATTLELMRAIEAGESIESMSADFEAVLGVSFEEVEARYDQVPACDQWRYRVPLMECLAPPMGEKRGVRYVYSSLDCADEDVLGPSHRDVVHTTRTLDITTASETYWLQVKGIGETGANVRIGRCDGGCEAWSPRRYDNDTQEFIGLAPGRYWVRLSRRLAEPGDLGVEVYPP